MNILYHKYIHSLNEYLSNTYYMLCTIISFLTLETKAEKEQVIFLGSHSDRVGI
jgi:hypothetical protein